MANIAIQKPTLAGVAVARQAAVAGGDTFLNDGATYLEVENPTGGGVTVNIARGAKCNEGFTHNVSVVVDAAAIVAIGPFPREQFGSPVAVAYTAGGLNVRCHR